MSETELRELDREVAEKVMGWSWAVEECQHPILNHGRCRKPDGTIVMNFTPSTDIAAAWVVHRAMCGRLYSVRRRYLDAIQERARLKSGSLPAWPDVLVVLADRFPEAVCRAALKACEAG